MATKTDDLAAAVREKAAQLLEDWLRLGTVDRGLLGTTQLEFVAVLDSLAASLGVSRREAVRAALAEPVVEP